MTAVMKCLTIPLVTAVRLSIWKVEGATNIILFLQKAACLIAQERTRMNLQSTTQWSDKLSPICIEPFDCFIGPTILVPSSLFEIFLSFFTELINGIVDTSNSYAKETMHSEKYAEWPKITPTELRAYLGFQMLMSINRLPSLDDYWSKNPCT